MMLRKIRSNFWVCLWAFGLLQTTPAVAQEGTFVGAERCRSCHIKAYDIWVSSDHAKAQTSLSEERRNELRCLFCHATDAQANLSNYTFANVQCEACHGPGARHIALAVKGTEKGQAVGGLEVQNEAKCKSCHGDIRSPNLRSFKYESALQKIRHW